MFKKKFNGDINMMENINISDKPKGLNNNNNNAIRSHHSMISSKLKKER